MCRECQMLGFCKIADVVICAIIAENGAQHLLLNLNIEWRYARL
jgi:hypothetical protein